MGAGAGGGLAGPEGGTVLGFFAFSGWACGEEVGGVGGGGRGGGRFGVPRGRNGCGVLCVFRGGVRRRSGLRRRCGGNRAFGGTTVREKNRGRNQRKKEKTESTNDLGC